MTLQEYRDFIQSFAESKLPAKTFETEYIRLFQISPPEGMDRELFDILEDLFEDADAFSPNCSPEEETPIRISEQTLRKKASDALTKLDDYLRKRAEPYLNRTMK